MDVSVRSMRAVLMQAGPDQFHPILFFIKKLSERVSHLSVSEKEGYTIVYAIREAMIIYLGMTLSSADWPFCSEVASHTQTD